MKTKILLTTLALITIAISTSALAEWSEPVFIPELQPPGDGSAVTPFLSNDGLTMYHGRHLWPSTVYDFVEAYRDTPEGPFTSKRVISELTGAGNPFGPWVSGDQLRMYYSDKDAHIKMAQRNSINDSWEVVRTLDEIHSGSSPDSFPSLTADELMLFWCRKDTTTGNNDIFVATRTSVDLPFSDVMEVAELNTSDVAAIAPFIMADGLTIYFHSKAEHPQQSIYKASRYSINVPFSNITLLDFCTPDSNQSQCYVTPDEKTIYFRSNMGGLWGIYEVHDLTPPYEEAKQIIEQVIVDKNEEIEFLDFLRQQELDAVAKLSESLRTGDLGALTTKNISTAMRKIISAVRMQIRAKWQLKRSVRELQSALDELDPSSTEQPPAGPIVPQSIGQIKRARTNGRPD